MFCGNCGNKLNEGAKFCPSCGSSVPSNVKNKSTETEVKQTNAHLAPVNKLNYDVDGGSKVNVLFVICSFIVPILGLIFFAKDKDSNPKNAKACGIAGISGFALNIVVTIVAFVIGFMSGFSDVINEYDDYENKTTSKKSTIPYTEPKHEDKDDKGSVSVDPNSDNNWDSYKAYINGKELSIPCTYEELANITGYNMKENAKYEVIPKNKYVMVNMLKDGKSVLYVDILNRTENDVKYVDGEVAALTQTKSHVDKYPEAALTFPGGLVVGASITESELNSKFGEPTKRNEYTGSDYTKVTYTYAENEKWTIYNKYEIVVIDGIIDELELDRKGN